MLGSGYEREVVYVEVFAIAVEECHEHARRIIGEHEAVLDETARQLIEKERLSRGEFEKIFIDLEGEGAVKAAPEV